MCKTSVLYCEMVYFDNIWCGQAVQAATGGNGMEHTVEKLPGNKVKISFAIPSASFDEALGKAYLKQRGRISVPGFRKGKAPRAIIERMYGEGVFYDDALETLFPDAYTEAIAKNDLHPVSRPEVDVQEMEKGKDLRFTCEFFVQPEVKLGKYKGIEVKRMVRSVSPEEVEARITQEQKRVARSLDVTDRPVENGDQVQLDYSGTVDGVQFDGGTAEGQTLVIGSGNFIPGFEEQMVGMMLGDEKDIRVTFPEKYHSEELQGKEAVFHVKVNAITREELPELDDEFASEVSDFDTFQEYKEDIQAKLQSDADDQATSAAKESMVEAIVQGAEIDIPAPMVEDKLDEMMDQMAWRMQQQGIPMDKYLELTGQTGPQMRDMYRKEAEEGLRTDLVIDEIIKVEAIEADDAAVDKLLEEYAPAMGQSMEQLKQSLTEGQMAYFTKRVKTDKALDMLWESAKVKDEKAKPADSSQEAEPSSEKGAGKKKAKSKADKA